MAQRDTGETHADIGADAVDRERRGALVGFLAHGDLVAQLCDFTQQFVHFARFRRIIQGCNQLDRLHPGDVLVLDRGYPATWLVQLLYQRGIAFVDLPSTVVWFDEAGRHQESLDSERPVGEQLLTHFYRAVTSLVRHTCDLEDAYRAICVVQAARRSHEEGRRIEL